MACRTRVLIIPDNKEVHRVERDKSFLPKVNGWFVPDSRMLEILNKISQEKVRREHE